MVYRYKLTDVIPATPREIYDTWLDSRGHRAMTGAKAKQSAKVGAAVTAWGEYISGKNLELVPAKRIVQSWRTTQFAGDHKDSKITVTLKPVKDGTRMTLVHSGVPDGQTSYEKGGWQTHYFEPMKAYFGKRQGKKAAKKTAKKTAKKKVKRA